MKHIFYIFLIFFAFSCASTKKLQPSYQEKVRYETIIKERVDTVYVELPKEYVEVFRQDSSFIETSVAWSEAKVDSLGFLYHTLSTKKDVKVEVKVKEVEVIKEVETIKEIPVEVEVVKTKYPRSFWYLLVLVILLAGWKVFKIFKYVI